MHVKNIDDIESEALESGSGVSRQGLTSETTKKAQRPHVGPKREH